MLVSVYINTKMKLYMSRPSLTLLHAKKRKVLEWSAFQSVTITSVKKRAGQQNRTSALQT